MNIISTMDSCFTKTDQGLVVSRQLHMRETLLSPNRREVQNPTLSSYGDFIVPGEYRRHSRFSHVANYLLGKHLISLVDPSIGAGPLNIVVENGIQHIVDRVIIEHDKVILDHRIYVCTTAVRYDSSLPILSLSDLQLIKNNLPTFKRILRDCAPEKSIAFLLDESEELHSPLSFESILKERFLRGRKLIVEGNVLEAVRTMKGLGFGLTPSGDDFISGFVLGLNLQQIPLAIDFQNLMREIFEIAQSDNPLSRAWLQCSIKGRLFEKMKQVILALGQKDPNELLRAVHRLLTVGSSSGIDMAVGFVFGMEYVRV